MDISGQTQTPQPPPAFFGPFLKISKQRSAERAKAAGKYREPTMTVDGIEYLFYTEANGSTNFRPVRKDDEWVAIGEGAGGPAAGTRPIKRRYSGGLEIPTDISGFGEYYDTNARDRSGNGGGADKTSE